MRRVPGQPAQAQARGRMGAGAEGRAGVQTDVQRGRFGRRVPGRHDPQAVDDAGRRELRLRQAHPVGIVHGARCCDRRWRDAELGARTRQHLRRIGRRPEQDDHDVARPREVFGLRARLAVQRLLGRAVDIGVADADRERAGRQQRFRQGLDKCTVEAHFDLAQHAWRAAGAAQVLLTCLAASLFSR